MTIRPYPRPMPLRARVERLGVWIAVPCFTLAVALLLFASDELLASLGTDAFSAFDALIFTGSAGAVLIVLADFVRE